MSARHGQRATCKECGDGIEYVVWALKEDEVLDAWWSHDVHPSDHHEAVPAEVAP